MNGGVGELRQLCPHPPYETWGKVVYQALKFQRVNPIGARLPQHKTLFHCTGRPAFSKSQRPDEAIPSRASVVISAGTKKGS
jgi:hypothetical protein